MQAQNFLQMELPLNIQKIDPLKQMEKAIQDMLDLIWKGVILHISVRATKALMIQHGTLIAFSNEEACIKVRSLPIFNLAIQKLPDIEAAFKKAFGYSIKVNLVVG
ncbi:hypothetical protein H6F61_09455 [Cyanobacteria bacterium FACHB-472]|nr:hypothetical protein [Cyanobacteria bacterium FACHB-472]